MNARRRTAGPRSEDYSVFSVAAQAATKTLISSRADNEGVIERDECDRHAIGIHLRPDPGRRRLQRLAGIEMPQLGEAPSCDLVDELREFGEGDGQVVSRPP
jgi:hypothetical protein